jgi:glycosyltransferase involved in cell wall biosynthesis
VSPHHRLLVLVDHFPELSETFVGSELRALVRAGHQVRVEPVVRGGDADPAAMAGLDVRYREDDPPGRRRADLAWLVTRHPVACLRDVAARRRWRREEWPRPLRDLAPCARRAVAAGDTHIHCHFAAGAALDGLRLSRILGLPLSITAHAYDIFLTPRNLREKLRCAAVVSTGCDYNVAHLRAVVGDDRTGRVHRIVMGVDTERFRRQAPLPGGRTVIAIGRLVEKKGFDDLVRAARILHHEGAADRVVIVGEGPQRDALERLVADVPIVELLGARRPDEVRALLEEADVLAMPSVVAADGDRDSMPVVVKEAMAMELPVVATDEVGLPEVVRPPWGRLVPPRDPPALARALAEVLALGAAERAEAGAAGRAWVSEHANVDREAERLAALLAAASGSG